MTYVSKPIEFSPQAEHRTPLSPNSYLPAQDKEHHHGSGAPQLQGNPSAPSSKRGCPPPPPRGPPLGGSPPHQPSPGESFPLGGVDPPLRGPPTHGSPPEPPQGRPLPWEGLTPTQGAPSSPRGRGPPGWVGLPLPQGEGPSRAPQTQTAKPPLPPKKKISL